jgi:Synergist-CTERM protein sorting domain-containing protein
MNKDQRKIGIHNKYRNIFCAMALLSALLLPTVPASATINGCTVSTYTIVNDPTNTDYVNMMNACSTIVLQDTLDIRFSTGFMPIGEKVLEFVRSDDHKGYMKTPTINLSMGTIKIMPTPYSSSGLGGDWATGSSLKSAPAELIHITKTNGYLDTSSESSITAYGGLDTDKEEIQAFWNKGYYIDYTIDTDSQKVKNINLSWHAVASSGDVTSGDVDDGGGGCNAGFGAIALLMCMPMAMIMKKR